MNPFALLARLRLPALFGLGIVLLLGMLDFASNDADTLAPIAEDSPLVQDYDYYITDMSTTRFSATGQPEWRLQASRVTHFPEGDIAHLENPRFAYFSAGAAPWQVTADSGTLRPDAERGEDRLDLEGNVLLRQAAANAGFTEITAQLLTLFTDSREAISAVPVLLQTPGTQLEGTGMRALLARDYYELHNSVRGFHVPPTP